MAKIRINRWARPKVTKEGLFYVFRPGTEGLACWACSCDNPECNCRDVNIFAVPIDFQTKAIELRNGTFLTYRQELSGIQPAFDEKVSWTVLLDIDTGELNPTKEGDADPNTHPKLKWLVEAMDGELLEQLGQFRLRSKGCVWDDEMTNPAAPLGNWDPGDMVMYNEVYPHSREDMYRIDGDLFVALEQYCISPSCECTKVHIAFEHPKGDNQDSIGHVLLNIKTGDVEFNSPTKKESLLCNAWSLFIKRHRGIDRIRERQLKMKKFGKEFKKKGGLAHRLQPVTNTATNSSIRGKPGRNDPCLCGSGKKYKKCCIDRELGASV